MKKKKMLWTIIDGEPFLVDPDYKQPPKGVELFVAHDFKIDNSGKARMILENPPQPFERLKPNAALSTDQVARHRRCSKKTVLRHVHHGWLRLWKQVGREFYFRKGDVENWEKRVPVAAGRPAKKERGRKCAAKPKKKRQELHG